MKRPFQFFAILLSFIFIIVSCGKDEESLDDDGCIGITCEHSGNCVDGTCECLENFTGPSCETPVSVKTVDLKSTTIKNFPVNDVFGASWDMDAGKPDITFQISDSDDNILYNHDGIIMDADANTDITFIVSNFTFLSPEGTYTFSLLDDDGTQGQEVITTYSFVPEYTDGISGPILLRGGSSDIDIQVKNNY